MGVGGGKRAWRDVGQLTQLLSPSFGKEFSCVNVLFEGLGDAISCSKKDFQLGVRAVENI